MPLTPFHLGPGLFIGLLFISFLDLPTFLFASIIVDVEPFVVLFLNLNHPLHGLFHSFLGGTLVAIPLAVFMNKIKDKLSHILSFFRLDQKMAFKNILVAALLGIYIHIILNSRLYTDIQPFFPSTHNPFLTNGILAGFDSYMFSILSFFGATIIYSIRLVTYWRKDRLTNLSV